MAKITTAFLLFSSLSMAESDLVASKSVDNPTPAPLNPVEFVVSVTNAGPDAALDIEAVDRLPVGMEIPEGMAPFTSQGSYDATTGLWQVGGLDALEIATLTIPAVPEQTEIAACYVNSVEIVSASTDDGQTSNDIARSAVYTGDATQCTQLILNVFTTLDETGRVEFIFDVEIRNNGPDDAENVEVRLSGLDNSITQTDRLFFDRVAAGDVVTGTMDWVYGCGLRAFTANYEVAVTTSSTAASDSVLETTGQQSVPNTGSCVFEYPAPYTQTCFIATAAYGSYLHPHVVKLGRFRDEHLLTNSLGRRFVSFYYRVSPRFANSIEQDESLRFIARLVLTPIVYAVAYPATAILGLLAFAVTATVMIWRHRRRSVRAIE